MMMALLLLLLIAVFVSVVDGVVVAGAAGD